YCVGRRCGNGDYIGHLFYLDIETVEKERQKSSRKCGSGRRCKQHSTLEKLSFHPTGFSGFGVWCGFPSGVRHKYCHRIWSERKNAQPYRGGPWNKLSRTDHLRCGSL